MAQQVHPIKKPKCISLIVCCTSTFLVWLGKETTRISNYSSNSWLYQLAVLRIPRGFILNLRHKMITLNLVLIPLCHDLNFHKKSMTSFMSGPLFDVSGQFVFRSPFHPTSSSMEHLPEHLRASHPCINLHHL